jgi:hypothetical protein
MVETTGVKSLLFCPESRLRRMSSFRRVISRREEVVAKQKESEM